MSKCLTTKYDGTASGGPYNKVGELKITQSKISDPTVMSQAITINNTKDCIVEIEGDGYFTEKNLTQSKGKTAIVPANTTTTLYVSNSNCNICIKNKYTLQSLVFGESSIVFQNSNLNKKFDLRELNYSKDIQILCAYGVMGDIAVLKNMPKLAKFCGTDTITGDISAIKDNVEMYMLFVPKNVTGDISAFSKMTKLVSFYATKGKITGDISSLATCTSLSYFILSSCIVGDISSLKACTSLGSINLYMSELTGDIAVLPASLYSISGTYNSSFTWSSRDSNCNIISLPLSSTKKVPYIEHIDKMLQDQANCIASSLDKDKIIAVRGTRTSASDAAVATLQSKGYTVSITPA